MGEFGDSVRQARIDRGLSQAQLGEPLYSRSYISLVETGRRAPSDEIVEHVAARLGVPTELVRSWALAQGDGGTTRAALTQAEVMSALAQADYGEASRAAARLSEFALTADRLDLWWTAEFLGIDARGEMGDNVGAARAAESLLEHWFTRSSAALTSRVLTGLSIAVRVGGDFDRAITCARRAVDLLASAQAEPGADVTALTALVSALAEADHLDEAASLLPALRESAGATGSRTDAGKAYWALGNVEFMCGEAEAGIFDHGLAMEHIDPNHDLRRWARLMRASAAMRLQAGVAVEGVPELLSRAATAFTISSSASDLPTLAVVQGSYALWMKDWAGARERFEFALGHEEMLTRPSRAEAHRKLGTALQESGAHAEAARHLAIALDLLSSPGGGRRAG